MTPAELYAFHFQSTEPKFYSRIPHIIDHLTYDEVDKDSGQVIIKRLSVHAIQFYRIIKSITGDEGICWQNRDKLAELANMSAGSVTNAKAELQKHFHQLDGNPLIKIDDGKKTTHTNGTIYHKVMILDIWKWNNAFMATLNVHKKKAPSPNDGANQAPSPNDGAPLGAPSPGDTNNIKQNKNPLSKEQQPVASATAVCPLDKKEEDVSVLEQKTQAFNWFIKIGCDVRSATHFVENFSIDDIKNASLYVKQMIEKKKTKNEIVPNVVGYLRKTLENKWWLPRKP